jgi:hypothetical protein
MLTVSVQTDIEQAIRELRLLPKEANRAAYRAMNKVADDIKREGAQRISEITGIPLNYVKSRMYVKGASANRLIAVVAALPSAKNVGKYQGAFPAPGKPGVTVTAWRQRTLYDRTFVMGTKASLGAIPRKVWRRTGPGKHQITDQVWGPSIRKTFERPAVYYQSLSILQERWPKHFERYLRAELVRLRGAHVLAGINRVLPNIQGPVFTGE